MLPVIDLCNRDGVQATCRLAMRMTPFGTPRCRYLSSSMLYLIQTVMQPCTASAGKAVQVKYPEQSWCEHPVMCASIMASLASYRGVPL